MSQKNDNPSMDYLALIPALSNAREKWYDWRYLMTIAAAALCCTVVIGWLASQQVLADEDATPASSDVFSCANMMEVSTGILGESVPVIEVAECEALVQFYNALGGDNWTIASSQWLESDNPCSWLGIRCRDRHVTHISLSERNLVGQIPGAALSALPELATLYLSSNSLTGQIPTQLAALPNLAFLGLADNQLTGPIPESLLGDANPDYLRFGSYGFVSLDGNDLSGTLPLDTGRSRLSWFDVQDNQNLTGPVPEAWENIGQYARIRVAGTRVCLPDDWVGVGARVYGASPCSTIFAEGIGAGFEICEVGASTASEREDDTCSAPQVVEAGERVELDHGPTVSFPMTAAEQRGARLQLECDGQSLLELATVLVDTGNNRYERIERARILLILAAALATSACEDGIDDSKAASQIQATAQDDGLVMRLEAGAVTVEVEAPITMGMETETVAVSATQGNRFFIGHDPQTGQTQVTAYSGTVTVSPDNAEAPTFTLATGESVTLSEAGPGEIVGGGILYVPHLQR